MNIITRANLRTGGRRLIAAGIAVVVSVGFVVAAFVLTHSFTQTMRAQAEQDAAGTDIVVSADPEAAPADPASEDAAYEEGNSADADGSAADAGPVLDDGLVDELEGLDGVGSAQLLRTGYVEADIDGTRTGVNAGDLPAQRDLDYASGSAPVADDEIAVPADIAEAWGVEAGDSVELGPPEFARTADGASAPKDYTAAGIIDGPANTVQQIYLTSGGMDGLPMQTTPESVRIVLADGDRGDAEAQQAVQEDIAGMLADGEEVVDDGVSGMSAGGFVVQTNEQAVDEFMEDLTGSSNFLLGVVLGFGVIAIVVAALVIANTFQVLVASRTRTLALLRAVGASRGQIRRATIAESLVLGVVASAVGVLAGWGLSAALAGIARATWLPEFASASLTLPAILVGPAIGILMTVIAGLGPARKATQVSPMVALRPLDVAAPADGIPWVRTVIGAVLAVVGLGGTVAGALAHNLLVALPSAVVGFLGVLLLSRLIVPVCIRVLSRVLSAVFRHSPVLRLVGDTVSQAPRRTASTTAAVLIGVTLVSTMTIGATTVQDNTAEQLAESSPVDLAVTTGSAGGTDAAAQAEEILSDSPVVGDTVTLPGFAAPVEAQDEDGSAVTGTMTIVAVDDEAIADIARADGLVPESGEALVSSSLTTDDGDAAGLAESAPLTVGAGDGTGDGKSDETGDDAATTIPGRAVEQVPDGTVVVTPETLEELGGDTVDAAVWARVADDASSAQIQALTSDLTQAGLSADPGPALERAMFDTVITTALTIVLVLLVAAIIIAVVGVGNTLSLSVLERRREAALLRALGMGRGAVAGLIAVEALLMAVVALVIGVGLGMLFGWAGPSSLLAGTDLSLALSVPWLQVAGIAAATLLAAAAASALPARTMSRTPPAQGLSAE